MNGDLIAARDGDQAAFARLVDPHRHELSVHAYRMLGSATDAEDALQETLLAAWKGLSGFEGRSTLRTWLYRIATNVCLRLAENRANRLLSFDHGPAWSDVHALGEPVIDRAFVEPWPGGSERGTDVDPEVSYLQREGVELAYVAALQHLPATQRAVLLLREVLGYRAAEVADLLDTTSTAIDSLLQRARAGIAARVPSRSQQAELATLGPERERMLVSAFVDAWERGDVPALVALLTDDVRFTMPPLPAWFEGRRDVARFLEERVFASRWRLAPIRANAQPALACYQHDGDTYRLAAVNLLHLRGGSIAWIAGFVDPAMYRAFDLAPSVQEA